MWCYFFKMNLFWNGTRMCIDKANPVVLIEVIGDLRGQLKLKNVIHLVSLVLKFDIQFSRYRQVVSAHDFPEDVPGDAVIFAIGISVSKNKCSQIALSCKNAMCRFFCSIAFDFVFLRRINPW